METQYIIDAEAAMVAVSKSTRPGAYLVDVVPPCEYMIDLLHSSLGSQW